MIAFGWLDGLFWLAAWLWLALLISLGWSALKDREDRAERMSQEWLERWHREHR